MAMALNQRQLAEQLPAQAKKQGVELVGPNGLLNQLTKNVEADDRPTELFHAPSDRLRPRQD